MCSSENDCNNDSRRSFLKNLGLTIGGGVVAGSMLSSCSHEETGKKVKVLTQDGKLVEVDSSSMKDVLVKEDQLTEQQKRGREGIAGKKWVMVIDLAKCRNARKCMDSCQAAHSLRPEQHHINVLRMKDSDNTEPYFMPKMCFHCDNPPCTKVCPVNATFKRQDGIVLIDNERCIGCRYCIAACPYSSRVFNWFEPNKVKGQENMTYDIEKNVPQKKGTVTKCLFSADRLRENKLPYCVSACPNGVYWFGDKNEDAVTNGTTGETTNYTDLVRENAGYTYMEELGTKPSVIYLPPRERKYPFEYEGKTSIDSEHS